MKVILCFSPQIKQIILTEREQDSSTPIPTISQQLFWVFPPWTDQPIGHTDNVES